MKNLLIFTIIFGSVFGCQKAIEIDRDRVKPKLVVNCLLSPNLDTVKLSLSESRDLLYDKTTFPIVTDASVSLYEDGTKIGDLVFIEEYYTLPYNVKEGSIYKIEVSKTGFDDVNATTKVNKKISSILVDVEKLENGVINAKLTISDIIGEDSYFMASMKWADFTTDSAIINDPYYYEPYYQNYNCSNDFIIEYPQTDAFSGSVCSDQFLFTDASFKNKSYTLKLSSPDNNYYYPQEGYKTRVIIDFKSVNYDFYTYYITRAIFMNNFGNPFAEPVPVYNNIENGYGIFGTSSNFSDTLVFE